MVNTLYQVTVTSGGEYAVGSDPTSDQPQRHGGRVGVIETLHTRTSNTERTGGRVMMMMMKFSSVEAARTLTTWNLELNSEDKRGAENQIC